MSGADLLIEGRQLVVDYGERGSELHRALDHVDITVAPREIVGVVGESGSGKSTLGRVVAGLMGSTEGSLRIRGELLPTVGSAKTLGGRRDVQMIFQDSVSALDPRMKVWRSIAEAFEGRSSSGLMRRRAIDLLENVGLSESHADRRPKELSGGQRQRVAIARAIAAEPAVLVCDEAVSALDVSVRAKILNLLIRIRREQGVAMVFISHDLSVVSQLVDRVIVMYRGQVVEEGMTEAVMRSPQDPYTQRLLDAIPRLERAAD